MKVVDVISPERVNRAPDKTIVLLSSGSFVEQGLTVKRVQLNLYIQKKDEKLGLKAIKDILKEMSVKADEVALNVDESLVGGWRLEVPGRPVAASWKKDLLSIYNRSIA